MTGGHDLTAERLAQLADGATPETDAEREAVLLMAEVRGIAEPAPEAVRERVRAIASAEAPASRGWRPRRLALVAAPVAATIVALAIAIPVATRDDGGSAPPPAADAPQAAAPQADAPADPRAGGRRAARRGAGGPRGGGGVVGHRRPPGRRAPGRAGTTAKAAELDRAVARARATLEDAGATGVRATESAGGTAATVVAEVPADQVGEATTALEAQGAKVVTDAEGGAPTGDGPRDGHDRRLTAITTWAPMPGISKRPPSGTKPARR